ncbi:MAG: iron ABC transporter permease [Candidatus Thorarchaeota archaeon]|nr:MAG: iron ABC transporter permease [Candidatus Thorarchaeota archaeon]
MEKRVKGHITERIGSLLVIVVPIVILLIFLVYPVIVVLIGGIISDPFTILVDTFSSQVTQRTLWFTLGQAGLSTLLSVLVGLPGAYFLTRFRFRGRSLLRALILVPFVLPPIVVVVGFLRVFGSGGLIDAALMTLLNASESVVNLSSGILGIVLAHVFYNIPLVILMVSASLERLSPEVEESAEILGASVTQKFVRIVAPQIKSSVAASSILIFMFCFMSFPIVLALGEGRLMTLEVQIWNAFRYFEYDEASILALTQVVITLALAYSYVKLTRTSDDGAVITSYMKTRELAELANRERILVAIYVASLMVLVAGPFIAIVQAAVFDPFAGEYTFRGFTNLLAPGTGGGLLPLLNSLSYSLLATILAVVLGLSLAYSHKSRVRAVPSLASSLTLLPLGVSAITVAYGLMLAITVPLGLNTNPWMVIVVAQTIIGLPFSTRAIEIALQNIDPEILDQADSLGASRLQRLLYVEFPLLAPGILVGAVFAFAMAIGEMSATLFIALPQNTTLSIAIYQFLGVRKFVEAGASALIVAAICFIAFLVIERFSETAQGGTP